MTAHTSRPCGACLGCTAGRSAGCTGWTYHGFNGFADWVVLPTNLIEPLADPQCDTDVLIEPLYVAQDLVEKSGAGIDDRVLLLGVGPVALLALRCLSALSVKEVFAVHRGYRSACAELARRWGATVLTISEFHSRAGVLSCDAAIVTAPYSTVSHAVPAVRRAGTIVYNGITDSSQVTLDLHELHVRRISLVLSFPHPQTSFAAATALVRADASVLSELISHRVPLSQAPSAFALFDRRPETAVKVVVTAD